jgi:hypothetical protein
MPGLIPGDFMKWRWLSIVCFAAVVAIPACPRAEGMGDELPPCDMPADMTTPSAPLSRVSEALAKGSVEILALGSGSTVGEAAGSNGPAFNYRMPEASFPRRMLEVLQTARPAVTFDLTVKGGRNMTADTMYATLAQELTAHHYDLVLWQTGTVEAVRGLRPDTLRGVLEEGAEVAQQAGADVVLIDPQFSRFLRANTDMNPYETVLEQIAGLPGVSLFRRYELTRGWVANDQIDLERVDRNQRDKTVMLLNVCLGHALARYVLTGAAEH